MREAGMGPDMAEAGEKTMRELREKGLVASPEEAAAAIREVVQGPDRAKREQGIKVLEEQVDLLLESAFDLSADKKPNKALVEGLQQAAQTLKDGVDKLKGELADMDEDLMGLQEKLEAGERGQTVH